MRSNQCQLDRIHSHGPQACPSPVSAAQHAVVLRSPGVKTSPPPDQPAPPGKCGCGTPPGGVGKCRRVWRVWQKSALSLRGNEGISLQRGNGAASSAPRDIHGYGDKYLHVVRMTGRMPLARPYLGSREVWRERMTQVRSAHTAAATPQDGR